MMKSSGQLVRSCRALMTVCVGAAALILACANPDQPTEPTSRTATNERMVARPLTSVSFDVEYAPGNPGKGAKSETFHIDRKRGRRGGWNTSMLLPLQSIALGKREAPKLIRRVEFAEDGKVTAYLGNGRVFVPSSKESPAGRQLQQLVASAKTLPTPPGGARKSFGSATMAEPKADAWMDGLVATRSERSRQAVRILGGFTTGTPDKAGRAAYVRRLGDALVTVATNRASGQIESIRMERGGQLVSQIEHQYVDGAGGYSLLRETHLDQRSADGKSVQATIRFSNYSINGEGMQP